MKRTFQAWRLCVPRTQSAADNATSGRGKRILTWMGLEALVGMAAAGWRIGLAGLAVGCGLGLVEVHAAHALFQADPDYLIASWQIEDGLPDNALTAMVQGPDGYLWFGTFNGLVRFDGVKFTVLNPANTLALPSAEIANLHSDRRGRLWISTLAGLAVKDGTQWRALGINEGWVGNYVRTFAERDNGDLLITTFDGHVLVFENNRLLELPSPPGEPGQGYLGTVDEQGRWWVTQNRFVGRWTGQQWISAHTPSPSVGRSAVACASALGGGVWVLLAKELFRFRGENELSRFSLPQLQGGVWMMSEDSQKNLWICSYDSGLFRVTPGGEVRHWTATNGLEHASTRFVFEDQEGNLWIGTNGGGLKRFKRRRFTDPGAGNLLSGRVARSISPARDQGMWIASFDAGLLRCDETGGSRVPVPGPRNESAYGTSVLESQTGDLWYGDVDSCWWRSGRESFVKAPLKLTSGANVSALFEDSQGRVWIATSEGAAVYDGQRIEPLGPEAGLPRGGLLSFGEDKSGHLWVAASDGVFRQERERFVQVRGADGQYLRGVLCFKAEADGSMWMGLRDNGLMRWRQGDWDRIGVDHGLPDREVRGIIQDSQDYFWMPSDRGIIRTSRKQLQALADGAVSRLEYQLLDQHDGLPSAECPTGQPTCARDAAGRIWFATRKGVAVVDPASFRVDVQPPPVHVESFSYRVPNPERLPGKSQATGASGREIRFTAPLPSPLRLPPGSYGLEVEYTALSYSAPEKIRFQFKLEGNETEWEDVSNRRIIRFYQLQPREYIFRVRAANGDGLWNEAGANLAFTVLPFYWQTWWFRLGGTLVLMGLGGAMAWRLTHNRVRRALEREKTAHEILELRGALAHSGRVTLLGQLASALAHELSQPLGAILRNAEAAELMLQEPSPDLEELRAIVTDIRQDDQRAGGVIDRLRSLLKRRSLDLQPLALNDVIAEVLLLISADASARRVKVDYTASPDLPSVRGDRIHLQQVLLNLLVNAMDALVGAAPHEPRIQVTARRMEADRIEVRVCDNGPGLPSQPTERLFEPFFTTKATGMGMGLAVSKTIIDAHKGSIWAENRPEGGACFCFTLPTCEGIR